MTGKAGNRKPAAVKFHNVPIERRISSNFDAEIVTMEHREAIKELQRIVGAQARTIAELTERVKALE